MIVLCYPVSPATLETEPTGWYSPHEIGRLAGVSGDQIGQWARYGYMQSARASASPRSYAYQDAAEAMVLHFLRDHGVPYRSIRKAVRLATEKYGARWPLSSARLFIISDHPQIRGPKSTVVVDDYDIIKKHPVLGQLDLVEVKRELERGGWAARENPNLQYIQVDPGRHSGTPVIRGTRIPAELVAETAERWEGRRILRDDYGLSNDQIDDAVSWHQLVSSYDRRQLSPSVN